MKSAVAMLLSLGACVGSAWATLPNGAVAPDFTTEATLAGKPFQFSLAQALLNRFSVSECRSKVIYSYSALNPDRHVSNTLAAVKQWVAAQPH